jgi:hypothetical protein
MRRELFEIICDCKIAFEKNGNSTKFIIERPIGLMVTVVLLLSLKPPESASPLSLLAVVLAGCALVGGIHHGLGLLDRWRRGKQLGLPWWRRLVG